MPTTCFISYEIHPTTFGGAGVLIHHAVHHLVAKGQRVVLLLDISEYLHRQFMDKDRLVFADPSLVSAARVDDLCVDFPYTQERVPCIFQWKSLRFAHALRALMAREKIDVVEGFEYCGATYDAFVERLYMEAPRASGALPVLAQRVHGSIEVLDRHGDGLVADLDRLMLHAFEHRAMELAEAVLVPTRTYYQAYYRELYNLDPERVVVSSPPKQPFPKVTRRPAPGAPFSIAFIGRMFHLKGVDQLVHAAVMLMKRRPELSFTVDLMGYDAPEGPVPGSYSAYLRTLIPQRLRERFIFAGQQSHAQISERLGTALFAVFPNRVESFCYALHEVYDAGVPVVINDLPAFADFFRDGHNAVVYDGTTTGLQRAMERMIDDAALRARVTRPYAVAEDPLGDFYDHPRARSPLVPPAGTDPAPVGVPRSMCAILCRDGLESSRAGGAIKGALAQSLAFDRVVCLIPATPDGEETLWWLGQTWHARTPTGEVIEPSDLITTDALAVFDGADEIDAGWHASCSRALSRRGAMAFAGGWQSRAGGAPVPGLIDLAPELQPFERGSELSRVLVRTTPGTPLADLLDASLGALGHVGLVWDAVARIGHGTLLPRVLVRTSDPAQPPAADAMAMKSLLLRFGGPFAQRIALYAGILRDRTPTPGPTALPPSPATLAANLSVEAKLAIANELGGKSLARLVAKKLAKRLG
jgi:glycosyltransferase involved in cell wall biosynthesis